MPDTTPPVGPLDLLVIQPTPFCNLDCTYCYLPDRRSKKRIAPETLDRLFKRVFASRFVERPFTVVWHAGEPLVLPPAFYEDAFAIADRNNATKLPVIHSFQTNATLLTPEWCEFIERHPVRIGVSIDGPEFLHDRCRKTRSGAGTLDRVLAGVRLLHEYDIPFSVITVLTNPALDYPDELFEFYREHNIASVGFNVEEVEGPHQQSSLTGGDATARFARFLSRFYDLAARCDPPLSVREFEFESSLRVSRAGVPDNHQTRPMAIVSVDCDGNFGTFSPELVGLPAPEYGGFALGNVTTDSFDGVLATPRFRAMAADVAAGVERCRTGCPYFAHCGGGAPANKYFENGSFATSETMFCRLTKQTVIDVMLDKLVAR